MPDDLTLFWEPLQKDSLETARLGRPFPVLRRRGALRRPPGRRSILYTTPYTSRPRKDHPHKAIAGIVPTFNPVILPDSRRVSVRVGAESPPRPKGQVRGIAAERLVCTDPAPGRLLLYTLMCIHPAEEGSPVRPLPTLPAITARYPRHRAPVLSGVTKSRREPFSWNTGSSPGRRSRERWPGEPPGG